MDVAIFDLFLTVFAALIKKERIKKFQKIFCVWKENEKDLLFSLCRRLLQTKQFFCVAKLLANQVSPTNHISYMRGCIEFKTLPELDFKKKQWSHTSTCAANYDIGSADSALRVKIGSAANIQVARLWLVSALKESRQQFQT